MAETNVDIYKSLGQNNQQMTPLQILQLVGAANQNKLFNQTYDSREKIGQAWKNNVGPDGKINNSGLMRDVAGAGFLAPEAAGQAILNSTNQFNLDATQLKFAQQTLAPLAAKKDLSMGDISLWSANAARAGVPHDVIKNVMDASERSKTPEERRKAIATQGIMSQGLGALEDTEGTPNAEGQIPKTFKGSAVYDTINQDGGRVVTNRPGFETAAQAGGTASAAAMQEAQKKSESYPAEMYAMRTALDTLRKHGKDFIGPGTADFNKLKSFVQSNAPSWLPGYDKFVGNPNDISDYDQLEKYLLNISTGIAGRFGHGTDQAASMAVKGSPNVHISSLAGDQLLQVGVGMRKMEQAMIQSAIKQGIPQDKWQSYAAKWAKDQDPAAYMLDTMTAEQREKLKERLAKSPIALKKFQNSYGAGVEHELIETPALK